MNKLYKQIVLYISLSCVTSCSFYSFTGTSIPPSIKTVSIHYVKNEATLFQPNLSNIITENLINKCQTETNLSSVDSSGDIEFYGIITNYNITPVAINSAEQATQNRLTISVEINFLNKIDETKSFKTVFTQYKDFSTNDNFSAIEENLCSAIAEELIDDIFNMALVNW